MRGNARQRHSIHDRPEKLDEYLINIDEGVPGGWALREQICIALQHPPSPEVSGRPAERRQAREGRRFRQAQTLPASGIWTVLRPVE